MLVAGVNHARTAPITLCLSIVLNRNTLSICAKRARNILGLYSSTSEGLQTLKHENNPWGVSPAEVRAIEAVLDTGCIKLGSRKLGVTEGVLENRTANARKKMNARFALTSYLMWDRYRMEASDGKLPELQHGPRKP